MKMVELKTTQPVQLTPRELVDAAMEELPNDITSFVIVADTSEGLSVLPINIDLLEAIGLLETAKAVLTNEFIKI